MIGTTLAHYQITAALGAGGMGEVWRATDLKLGREVALKVLSEEFASDSQLLDRFEREARAVAALNHPHIVTIFSVEEAEGTRFLTMELIEGPSLDALIPGSGLEPHEFFKLATPLAEAISAAHDKSVVHRDLKPGNVMVDGDGRVKVLDFGLAKLQEPTDVSDSSAMATEGLTGIGMVVGTVPYMSPEQVEGKMVDHRTDIFSLGVVLYEMATGERPFVGESAVGLMSSILRDVPAPVGELRDDFPNHLGRIVSRCLQKNRRDRYQTARDVFNELRALRRELLSSTGAPASSQPRIEKRPRSGARPSSEFAGTAGVSSASGAALEDGGFWVAVLPFKYTGSDADLMVLAEGLSEEIGTGFSRFSYLRVIAQGSKVADARYLMEGSLRQAGKKLRVAVQLVDTLSGAHLWAESYDRDFEADDLFALQDDLVPRIVSTCGDHFGVLARVISEAVRGKPVAEMNPYEALMRGFGYHFRLTSEEHAVARDALERAVEQAPSNADCWAMLAWVYSHEFAHDFNPRPGSLDRALEAARRAVDIAPSNHVAQQVLAVVLFFRKENAGCWSAAERSMELNPLDGSNEAFFLVTFLGEWERGCALIRRGMELNPNHPGWYRAPLGVNEYRKEEYRAAVDEAVKANSPDVFWIHIVLAAASAQLDETEAARRALGDLLNQKPDFPRSGRALMEKWFQPGLVEHLIHGLRKAGLEEDFPGENPDRRGQASRSTVGRQSEFEELRAALETARQGRGSILCVAGEPGIGKTTLVEGFLASAAADGKCTIARGRCSERLGGSDAYLPILEALDSLLQGSEGVAAARIMKQAAPAWYAQIAPLSGDSDESARLLEEIKDATQERLKREFVALLRELSRSCPLIVFLDDLHWADVSTVDLLSFLGGSLESMNVLVAVTYRPSDMLLVNHPFLQIRPDLQTRGLCRELLLEFLRESEVADYLALEFPDHRFPHEFPTLIHTKTEGNPLFMADLVRYLQEKGAIGQVGGQWTLEHGLPEIERELPESVRGMIERKIGQLAEDDCKLLTAASVQGSVFDSAVVAQVLGLAADEVEERLERLERVHAFVTFTDEAELPDRTLTLRYRFVHVLYQNTLFATLRATRKSRLSREFGQVLERVHGKDSPGVAHELAALFETGRDFARAAEYYLSAAGQAGRLFADREAATLAAQGITMVEMLQPSPDRAQRELELQLALGQALRTTKGYGHPDTGKVYSRARELCHDIGEAPQLFPVLFGLWEFLQNQGELESAVEVGEQMLTLARTVGESGLLVAAHGVMADNLLCIGDPVAACDHAAHAIALYDPDKHQSLASMFGYDSGVAAHSMAAVALWQMGCPDLAVENVNAAFDLANSLSHPSTLAFGAIFASWIKNWAGELETAGQMADRSVETATEFDIPALVAFGRLCQGWTMIAHDDAEAGAALAREGVEGLHASGFTWGRSFCLGVVAEGCAAAGRIDEALELLEEAFDHVDRTGERFHEAELWRLKGECLLRSENLAEPLEGEGCFLHAIEVAKRQQAKSWELRATTSLARLWRDQGRFNEAHETLEPVYSWFTEGFETSDLRSAKALLEELTGAACHKSHNSGQ